MVIWYASIFETSILKIVFAMFDCKEILFSALRVNYSGALTFRVISFKHWGLFYRSFDKYVQMCHLMNILE